MRLGFPILCPRSLKTAQVLVYASGCWGSGLAGFRVQGRLEWLGSLGLGLGLGVQGLRFSGVAGL